MSLSGIRARIEYDLLRGGAQLGGLGGVGAQVGLLGIGTIIELNGDEYIEIRVATHPAPARLARDIAVAYGLPVRLVRVVRTPVAHAQYAVTPGDSIGHVACSCWGTLGGFVLRPNAAYLLSNSHVIGLEGHGRRGDWIVDANGVGVARLHAASPLVLGRRHEADIAVARLVDGAVGVANARLPRRRAHPGDVVAKLGAQTGRTLGRVLSVDYSVLVTYATGTFWFVGQLLIRPLRGQAFSVQGDSGSLVRGYDGAGVGLLFAGDGRHTFANHLDVALAALGLPARP